MSAVELETAYISLLASGRELRDSIHQALRGVDVKPAAKQVGKDIGEATGEAAEKAKEQVEQAAAPRRKERAKQQGTQEGQEHGKEHGEKSNKERKKHEDDERPKRRKRNRDDGEKDGQEYGDGMGTRLGALSSKIFAPVAAAAAGIGIAGLLGDSINEASDFSEAANKIGAVFGDAGQLVQDFAANSATALGQSRNQALDAAATFGVFGKSAGLAGSDLAKFSTDFTGLASDLASFHNTSPEQAIEAIGAALRGESEPMRAYGVLIDDATMRQEALKLGLIKTTKEALNPQQKVLAAQALIYEQTADAQGDFANTSDGLANAQRIAAAQFADTKAKLGQGLLPVATKFFGMLNATAIPALNGVVDFTGRVGDALSDVWSILSKGDMTGGLSRAFAIEEDSKIVDFLFNTREWLVKNKEAIMAVSGGLAAAGGAAIIYAQRQAIATAATKVAAFVTGGLSGALTAVRTALTLALGPVGLVIAAVGALTAGVIWAYRNNEEFRDKTNAAFSAVGEAGKWLWESALKPALGFIKDAVFTAGRAGLWLWDNAFKPAFKAIGAVAMWLWDAVLKPYLKLVWFQLRTTGAVAMWLWDKAFKPAFTFIGHKAMDLWNKWLSPAYSWMASGVDDVAKATRTAINWMGRSWDSLREKARKPVSFVINKVLNPLIGGYNSIARVFDAPTISKIGVGGGSRGRSTIGGLQARADGGVITGWSPHDRADNILARLTAGEFVLPVRAVRSLVGTVGKRGLEMLRQGLMPDAGDPQAYASGGPVVAQEWMRRQAGKPYVWGGVGPNGYDCSGFTSATINAVRGDYPHRRLYATGQTPAGFSPGVGLVTIGIDRPGEKHRIGHTAINVAGLAGESRGGGTGVLVGGRARSVGSFNHQYHMTGVGNNGAWAKLKAAGVDLLNVLKAPGKWLAGTVSGALSGIGGSPFAGVLKGLARHVVDGLGDKLASLNPLKGWSFAHGGLVPDNVTPLRPTLYDEGGYLPPGLTLVSNQTGKPERVVAPHQEKAGITLNVDKIVGVDADDIARELHRQIKRAETLAGVG